MNAHLVLAALAGIATIVVLIVWLKIHPFLSLMAGAGIMAMLAGVPYANLFKSFTTGVGATMSDVGLLIVLGSIIGTLLVASGGADVIVDTILSGTSKSRLPWAMALIAFVIGIPLFFEVGVVMIVPVIMYAARRAKVPVMIVAIPALAGLSVLHGLVPPTPRPPHRDQRPGGQSRDHPGAGASRRSSGPGDLGAAAGESARQVGADPTTQQFSRRARRRGEAWRQTAFWRVTGRCHPSRDPHACPHSRRGDQAGQVGRRRGRRLHRYPAHRPVHHHGRRDGRLRLLAAEKP